MVKVLVCYVLIFSLLYYLGLEGHFYFSKSYHIIAGISIDKVYLFHAFFSGMLCALCYLGANLKFIKEQLGFIYLASFLLKFFLFFAFFPLLLSSNEPLLFNERLSLLVPVLLFLIPEVFFVVKILNTKDDKVE